MSSDLSELQKKIRLTFDSRYENEWVGDMNNDVLGKAITDLRERNKKWTASLLEQFVKEAYLAGARAYEDAVTPFPKKYPPLDEYVRAVKEGNMDDMFDYGWNTLEAALKEKSKAWWEGNK